MNSDSIEERLLRLEKQVELLMKAKKRLSPEEEQRIIVALREGFNPRQIAALIGRSETTVKRVRGAVSKKRAPKTQESVESQVKAEAWQEILSLVGAKLVKWNKQEVYTINGRIVSTSEILKRKEELLSRRNPAIKKLELCPPSAK